MPIHIYNTLTRKKEEFLPQNPPDVKMYTCGVTVYDECHIGHARSLYIFDVIKRYLEYRGYKVKFVRNITDIDDKIINKAQQWSNEKKISLKEAFDDVRKTYIDRYYEDLKLLGIPRADFEPLATENITDMKDFIQKLIKKGFAYEKEGNVYFAPKKYDSLSQVSFYGSLSGNALAALLDSVRFEADPLKEDLPDFVLWKKSKENEPSWDSPWGKGRPGWHIECSVMSQKFLKTDTLDVHAGGRDLIFPHHENEIAQSEALTGKPFAKYWIHHGLLTINGQKMAKSLGNFVTIKDFISKYKYADILKLFFLSAHYSQPIDYNQKSIEGARQALERITILIQKAEREDTTQKASGKFKEIEKLKTRFIEAMDNDFNTPEALASIFELVTITNKNVEDSNFLYHSRKALRELLGIFGISLKTELGFQEKLKIKDEVIIDMIKQREKARREKNYILSDKIRKELAEKGIILEDTKAGKTIPRRRL